MSLDFRTLINRLIPLVESYGNVTIRPNFNPYTLTFYIGGVKYVSNFASLHEMYANLLLIYQASHEDFYMSEEEVLRERKETLAQWSELEIAAWESALQRHDVPKCIYFTEKVLHDTAHLRCQRLCQKMGI